MYQKYILLTMYIRLNRVKKKNIKLNRFSKIKYMYYKTKSLFIFFNKARSFFFFKYVLKQKEILLCLEIFKSDM
jgi:hypothetical protein